MTILYKLLMRGLSPGYLLYRWWQVRHFPELRQRWSEHLALQSVPPEHKGGILLLCDSQAQLATAKVLLENLLVRYPRIAITLCTRHPDLLQQAHAWLGLNHYTCFLPLDSGVAMRRFLDRLDPALIILSETSRWPNLQREIQRRHITRIPLAEALPLDTLNPLRARLQRLNLGPQTRPRQERDGQNEVIWFDPLLMPDTRSEYFSENFWAGQHAIEGHANGRGSATFIRHGERAFLLRHYFRGGMVGKFNRDTFLGKRARLSRGFREFSLLQYMNDLHLPVPRPAAARMLRLGPGRYRADLIVEVIPDSKDLCRLLAERSLTVSEWQSVARSILQLHKAGVYHADLNCRNILLDSRGKAWVVDFDKCQLLGGTSWQHDNLARLHRSFRKECRKQPGLHWTEVDWAQLLKAYHEPGTETFSPLPPALGARS